MFKLLRMIINKIFTDLKIMSSQNLDTKDIEYLCAIESEEGIEYFRSEFKRYRVIFKVEDDLSLVSKFILKYNLKAEFDHPMFQDQNEIPAISLSLDNEVPQSTKADNKVDNQQKPSTSKEMSSSDYNDQASTSSFLSASKTSEPKKVNVSNIITVL